MAGVGFDLKKLFVGRGVIRTMRAYVSAGIVSSGTILLAVALMLGAQRLAQAFGATRETSALLTSLMLYALMGSLLLSSIFQLFLSRFAADQLYKATPQRVLPSLYGAAVILMVPGGFAYGVLLLAAREVSMLDKLLNWSLFMVLIIVWLQMTYISAVKDYRKILRVFLLGVVTALLLAWALLSLRVSVLTAIMGALVCGYGLMMVGFTRVLVRHYSPGEGNLFAFLKWISVFPDLLLTGFLTTAGAFAHLIITWFGPQGEVVAGWIRYSPLHDSAAFFAFLVTIPANINFVVSVEVNFYEKYQRYFSVVTGRGTLAELSLAREDMIASLQQEIFKLAQIQAFFTVAYAVMMRYYLESTGFTRPDIALFQMLCIGYGAFAVGNSLVLLMLYFNDRKGALVTNLLFFALNVGLTLYTMPLKDAGGGIGLTVAGAAMYLVGLIRLIAYVRNIDYHVYCEQPVLTRTVSGIFSSFAQRLDKREPREIAHWVKQREGKTP